MFCSDNEVLEFVFLASLSTLQHLGKSGGREAKQYAGFDFIHQSALPSFYFIPFYSCNSF